MGESDSLKRMIDKQLFTAYLFFAFFDNHYNSPTIPLPYQEQARDETL